MDDQGTSELPGAASSISPTADGVSPPTAPPRTAAGPSATASAEWPTKVADTIEDVVGALHDRIVRPLVLAARGVVFGIVIGLMSLVLFILLAVAVVRLLTVYAFSGRVWASDALVGALFVAGGIFVWSKARPKGATEES